MIIEAFEEWADLQRAWADAPTSRVVEAIRARADGCVFCRKRREIAEARVAMRREREAGSRSEAFVRECDEVRRRT